MNSLNTIGKTSGLALIVLLSAANSFAFGSAAPKPTPTATSAPESAAGHLCDAIAANDITGAQTVLSAGLDLSTVKCSLGDSYDQNSASPLWTAIVEYRAKNCPTMDMIHLLIKNGANINEVYPDDDRYTPLEFAVAVFETPAQALDLLAQGAAVVPAGCNTGCGNNLVAANMANIIFKKLNSADWVGLMSKFLDAGMQVPDLLLNGLQAGTPELWIKAANILVKKFPNQALFDGSLAYSLVANGVSAEVISWGLAHGLSLDVASGNQNLTPFQYALQSASLASVQQLMALSKRTIQPLDVFFAMGNEYDRTVFPFVLQNAPNLSAQLTDGTTVLMSVLINSQSSSVLADVLAKSQNLSLERNQEPSFALAIAAAGNSPDTVKALVNAGADVNQVSSVNQRTALQEAIRQRQTSNALILLQAAQKSINNVDKDGFTALTAAASMGSADLITAIVATNGVNVNAQDRNGETPLMYAVQANNVPSVVELLTHGACIKAIDNTGHTALEEAFDRNFTDVTSVLNIYLSQPGHC